LVGALLGGGVWEREGGRARGKAALQKAKNGNGHRGKKKKNSGCRGSRGADTPIKKDLASRPGNPGKKKALAGQLEDWGGGREKEDGKKKKWQGGLVRTKNGLTPM